MNTHPTKSQEDTSGTAPEPYLIYYLETKRDPAGLDHRYLREYAVMAMSEADAVLKCQASALKYCGHELDILRILNPDDCEEIEMQHDYVVRCHRAGLDSDDVESAHLLLKYEREQEAMQ